MIFQSDDQLYELLLCACTELEEDRWKSELHDLSARELQRHKDTDIALVPKLDFLFLEIEELADRFDRNGSFDRGRFIQPFSKLTPRTSTVPIVIRNTHMPLKGDPFESQNNAPTSSNRSHLQITTNAAQTLVPERSDRARMEQAMSDVWTRGALPFPAMITSRSGQLFRASSSMMRRLSKVSITSSPLKRSPSQRSRGSTIELGLDSTMDDSFIERSMTGGPEALESADISTALPTLAHQADLKDPRKVSFSDSVTKPERQKVEDNGSDTSTVIGKMSEEETEDKLKKPRPISRALSKEKIRGWFF